MIRTTAFIALALAASSASAQSFTEGFDGGSLLPSGWISVNNSPNGPGINPDWAQTPGSANDWLPHSGEGYAAADYRATVGAGDISLYLMSPITILQNGDTISFWTRTTDVVYYPDRMSVVFNTNGSTDPASFTHTLLTINPDLEMSAYPTEWTQYAVTVSGLPETVTSGRFAFWYNPSDGGPLGSTSDRIGIDDVSYDTLPAPGSVALLGLGALVSARRKR